MSGRPRLVVVMGVSGAGKTTVGRRLAYRLGWIFLDADDFHPMANVRKMAAGEPLDERDRRPWLESLARRIEPYLESDAERASPGAVLACSALRHEHRRILFGASWPGTRLGAELEDPCVLLVHLTGSRALLESRLEARAGHFMPVALLDSQLETLETPGPEALHLDVAATPDELVERIAALVVPASEA